MLGRRRMFLSDQVSHPAALLCTEEPKLLLSETEHFAENNPRVLGLEKGKF